MKRYTSLEAYLEGHPEWRNELEKLRSLLLTTELTETVKWGAPCYTINNKNVIGLGAFKSYVGIWFFQGVFLQDPKKVLFNAQEGKTKALRQWRFASVEEMNEELILEYIAEAIQNQKDGKEIKPTQKKTLSLPKELATCLAENENIRTAFEKFTPGKKGNLQHTLEKLKGKKRGLKGWIKLYR